MTDPLLGARTLILLLPHQDEPDVRIAMIQMSTIQAATFPADSNRIGDQFLRPLLERPGIYVLYGEKNSAPVARIGQSENVLKRLGEHRIASNKLANSQGGNQVSDDKSIYPHWETTFVFTSKDETLSTGHIRDIEHRLTLIAEKNFEFTLFKGQTPTEQAGALPLHEKVTASKFVAEVVLLAEVLGLDVFDLPAPPPVTTDVGAQGQIAPALPSHGPIAQDSFGTSVAVQRFHYNNHGVTATLETDGNTIFRVLQDSFARLHAVGALSASARTARENLTKQGILIEEGNLLRFSQDQAFKSLSLATQVVAGTTDWGKQVWRTDTNKTLGDWLEPAVDVSAQ